LLHASAHAQCTSAAAPSPLAALSSPLAKAAYTSASLSAVGDLVAQGLERRRTAAGRAPPEQDWVRTARLGAFGLLFYGPLQHRWYAFLNRALPTPAALPFAAKLPSFAAKVALNQLVLGPSVVTAVFAWNAAWTDRVAELPAKWRRDTLPCLRKGWAFWVPAASLNFVCAPRAGRAARARLTRPQSGAAALPGALHVHLQHRLDRHPLQRLCGMMPPLAGWSFQRSGCGGGREGGWLVGHRRTNERRRLWLLVNGARG